MEGNRKSAQDTNVTIESKIVRYWRHNRMKDNPKSARDTTVTISQKRILNSSIQIECKKILKVHKM